MYTEERSEDGLDGRDGRDDDGRVHGFDVCEARL